MPQKFLRTPLIVRADAPHMRQRLHDQVPCVEALRRLAPNASRLGGKDLRQNRTNDPARDLVLKLEDIFQLAIVFVRPQMDAVRGIDQLPGDTNPVGDLPHAALKDISHTELACDLAHVDRFTFEGKTRIARDDKEPALPGQAGNDVLGQPVGEILLFRIAAHVLKGQYGDRRFVGEGKRRATVICALLRSAAATAAATLRSTGAAVSTGGERPRRGRQTESPAWGRSESGAGRSPLSPIARRAALTQELSAASEIRGPARPPRSVPPC